MLKEAARPSLVCKNPSRRDRSSFYRGIRQVSHRAASKFLSHGSVVLFFFFRECCLSDFFIPSPFFHDFFVEVMEGRVFVCEIILDGALVGTCLKEFKLKICFRILVASFSFVRDEKVE